jgi:hypothetical protein
LEKETKRRSRASAPNPNKKAKTVKVVVKGSSASTPCLPCRSRVSFDTLTQRWFYAPVDPKSGLSETGRIYEDDGTNYNVVLNMSGTSLVV